MISVHAVVNGSKHCSKCLQLKDLSNFTKDKTKPSGYYSSCKACNIDSRKEYWRTYGKFNRKPTKDKEKERIRKLKYSRSEKGLQKCREWRKKTGYRYVPKTEEGRLKVDLRKRFCRIRKIIKIDEHTFDFVGYTARHLKQRLEFNFKKGMSWDNYGSVWHIDHIKPLNHFDYKDQNQVRLSWLLCNLQPMFKKENLQKGDKHPLSGKRPNKV